jgi:hypothetical protein
MITTLSVCLSALCNLLHEDCYKLYYIGGHFMILEAILWCWMPICGVGCHFVVFYAILWY